MSQKGSRQFVKKYLLTSIFVVLGLVLSSCANRPAVNRDTSDKNGSAEASTELDPELSDQAVQGLRLMIDNVEAALVSKAKSANEVDRYQLEKVNFWISYFTGRGRGSFQKYLHRGQKYREVVQTTLEDNGLPNELYYLAMIESGYSTKAYSRAKAAGVWQFIAATGRRYGLKYDYYIDERRDPIQATEGAAKYLRDLYNAFLSWELAMAAYNAGELRILRAIMDGKTRDFWAMAKEKRLPKETRNYVPKFIAAAIIGRNPEKYGFEDPVKDFEPFPSVVAFEVPSPISLQNVAKAIEIPHEELVELNPHFRRGVTPVSQSTYEVWIPEGHLDIANAAKEKLSGYVSRHPTMEQDPSDHHYHIVRSGDSLSAIARKYRISVSSLKRINGLASSQIIAGKKLRVSAASYRRPTGGGTRYVIRRGDSLGLIAKRYNTSIEDLKRINNLRTSNIVAGQSLILPGGGQEGKYQVRKGDTLEEVARQHGMSINELKSINGLNRNTIYVGEWLSVSQEI